MENHLSEEKNQTVDKGQANGVALDSVATHLSKAIDLLASATEQLNPHRFNQPDTFALLSVANSLIALTQHLTTTPEPEAATRPRPYEHFTDEELNDLETDLILKGMPSSSDFAEVEYEFACRRIQNLKNSQSPALPTDASSTEVQSEATDRESDNPNPFALMSTEDLEDEIEYFTAKGDHLTAAAQKAELARREIKLGVDNANEAFGFGQDFSHLTTEQLRLQSVIGHPSDNQPIFDEIARRETQVTRNAAGNDSTPFENPVEVPPFESTIGAAWEPQAKTYTFTEEALEKLIWNALTTDNTALGDPDEEIQSFMHHVVHELDGVSYDYTFTRDEFVSLALMDRGRELENQSAHDCVDAFLTDKEAP